MQPRRRFRGETSVYITPCLPTNDGDAFAGALSYASEIGMVGMRWRKKNDGYNESSSVMGLTTPPKLTGPGHWAYMSRISRVYIGSSESIIWNNGIGVQ